MPLLAVRSSLTEFSQRMTQRMYGNSLKKLSAASPVYLSTGQACQEDRDFLYCVTLAAAAVSELYGFS